jgi:hemoglobin-like flavoprotein
MTYAALVVSTMQAVADRHGDPTDAIYAELFGVYPELEALFWLDRDNSVRASMVQQGLECILDYTSERQTAPQIIAAARQHHDGYGVPSERFDAFFVAMRDAFRRIIDKDWTPEMDAAWNQLLAEFAAIR